MKLYYPFSLETRNLYLYEHSCFNCGRSDQGLELHHILGRSKYGKNLDSAFNSSLLCKKCHNKIGHSKAEQFHLFYLTQDFLVKSYYKPIAYDYDFVRYNYMELGLTDK